MVVVGEVFCSPAWSQDVTGEKSPEQDDVEQPEHGDGRREYGVVERGHAVSVGKERMRGDCQAEHKATEYERDEVQQTDESVERVTEADVKDLHQLAQVKKHTVDLDDESDDRMCYELVLSETVCQTADHLQSQNTHK